MSDVASSLRALVRDVPDYPKPGIVFKDITPVLADAQAFAASIEALALPFVGQRIDAVLGIESRGFMFAAPIALRLSAGFVPVRKPGKLPRATDRAEYALEYGTDAVEMHKDALRPGSRVLIVDDVIATGGTARAAIALAQGQGAEVVAVTFLLELTFLDGVSRLGVPSVSLPKY
ncbi:MAG: Adenine phosphoribosyltransferase [Myxococcaceae bacterium]|nr:Adenine phosphoribosyltransferase [Myxococcaceae bacterium]